MYTNRSRAIALVGLRGEAPYGFPKGEALGGDIWGRAPKPLIFIESPGLNSFHSELHDQLVSVGGESHVD